MGYGYRGRKARENQVVNLSRLCILIAISGISLLDNAYAQHGEDAEELVKANPSDILRVRRRSDAVEQAIYTPLSKPEPTSDSSIVTFDPSDEPITVYIRRNAPTSIMFRDITGSPWPVHGAQGFEGSLFDAKKVENEFKNSVILHGKLPAGESFLAVYLEGEPQPVTVKVVVSQTIFHTAKFIDIHKVGPMARVTPASLSVADEPGMAADSDLQAASFGVPPSESRRLEVDYPNTKAWEKDGNIYLRTKLNVFLPSHNRLVIGPGGYYAYKFASLTRTFTGTTEQGTVVHIKVGE